MYRLAFYKRSSLALVSDFERCPDDPRQEDTPRTDSPSEGAALALVGTLPSRGHRSKQPQTYWLKTINMYSLAILETRGSKSSVGLPPKARRAQSCLARWPSAPGLPRDVFVPPCVSVSLSLLVQGHESLRSGSLFDAGCSHLEIIHDSCREPCSK